MAILLYKTTTLCKNILHAFIGIGLVFISLAIEAEPQNPKIEAGDITIKNSNSATSANAVDTLILQQSQKGVIDWKSFNINEKERVHFSQPDTNSVTLNRITGGEVSSILGQLTATGKIFLINPSGIIFGPNSRIDVAGLFASTFNISNKNFLAGKYYFIPNSNNNAKIINRGQIKIAEHGMAYLVAPGIENYGIIEANLGVVVLGSTSTKSTYTVDFYGDQLIQFTLPLENDSNGFDTSPDTNNKNTIIQNGKIIAHGGKILLSANTMKSIVDKAINMNGIIEANTIIKKNGEIILSAGKEGEISINGKIKARGNKTGEHGGKVIVNGKKIGLLKKANIDVSGTAGGGTIHLGNKYSTDIYVSPKTKVLANAVTSGDGGKITILSHKNTWFYGIASAKGGQKEGKGGFIETSGKKYLDIHGARIDVSANKGATGTWLIDPYDVIINNVSSGGVWSGGDPNIWSANSTNSQLSVDDILSNLVTANIEINTGTSGNQDGDINWIATAAYNGTDNRSIRLLAANNITINTAISGANLDLILQTISSNGTININNNGINIKNFSVQGGTTNIATNTISTSLSQTYNTPVTIGVNTTLITTTNTGNIVFDNTIDSGANTSNTLTLQVLGNVTFNGALGNTNPLDSLTVNAGNINLNTEIINTQGAQSYSGAVSLGTDSIFKTTNANGDISFKGSVDSKTQARNLTIQTLGNVTLNTAIGGTSIVNILTINASGEIDLGGIINTIEAQQYNNPVILVADSTLTATSALGNITFENTVDSDSIARGLSINSIGNIRFKAPVGSKSPLRYLLINSTYIKINSNAINTVETQQYSNPVILETDSTLTTTNIASDIIFNSTIDSDTTARSLTIRAARNAIFSDVIGATNALASLAIAASNGINLGGGAIITSGVQQYSSAVSLLTDMILNGNVIAFVGPVDNANIINPSSLTINSSLATIFFQPVGATSPLQNIFTYGEGTVYLYENGITTQGYQMYDNAINLNSNTLLQADKGITFNSTIAGPFNLVLNTTTNSNVLFNDNVGAYGNSIGALYVISANDVTSTANIYATEFLQGTVNATSSQSLQNMSGNNTNFNNLLYLGLGGDTGFIHGTGPSVVITNKISGGIDLGEITLDTQYANLTGFVGGFSDKRGISNIKLLNSITPGTHFFNGIDMYGIAPTTIIDNSMMQSVLNSLLSNYNYGFGYEFLGKRTNEFDYVLLLDPLKCEIVVSK